MPKKALVNGLVIVNGVDLSTHADTLALTDSAADLDVTTFGGNGYSQHMPGLKDATITVEFFQDFDASTVHATLQPLYQTGGTFLVEVREDSTNPISATNPRGSMIASLYSYNAIDGRVGDALKVSATFRNAGNGITWGGTA